MRKPKYQVLVFPRAELDLLETREYFVEVLKTPSTKVFDRVLEAIDQLEENPMIYPLLADPILREKGYRHVPIDNFLLFFVIRDATVEIRRFLYGGRKFSALL